MKASRFGRVIVGVAAVAASALSVDSAFGTGNTVPGSRAGRYQVTITANTLKPAACAAITPTTVIAGVAGTSAANLLLGSAVANAMTGAGGNDCILGGGGDDSIDCGAGTDVAIGGPGTDTFNANCETQIQ